MYEYTPYFMDAFNKQFSVPVKQSNISSLFQNNKEYLSLLQRYSGTPELPKLYASDSWGRKLSETPIEHQMKIIDRENIIKPNYDIDYSVNTIPVDSNYNMGWWNSKNVSTYNEIMNSINNANPAYSSPSRTNYLFPEFNPRAEQGYTIPQKEQGF